MSDLKIGFIGLGDQGAPMAAAIAEAGFELHVWARRPQSYEALGEVPASRHDTPASLARAVDILCLCLRDDADIWNLLREQDLEKDLRQGSVLVNFGTGDPAENRVIGTFLRGQGVAYLDAPVSGGRPAAIARTLTTMVGGDEEAVERCRTVFETFSGKVAHMGPVGNGQLTKLLNNALTMTNLKNAVDVFAIARDLGLDIPRFHDVITVSSGSSAILQAVGRQVSSRMAVHLQGLMRKDIEHFADAITAQGMEAKALRQRGMDGADGIVDLARMIEGQSGGAPEAGSH